MLQKLLLYYNTIKYLRPVQVFGRIYAKIAGKLRIFPLPSMPGKIQTGLSAKTEWLYHDPWNNREEILKNNFTFLNKKIRMGQSLKWEPGTPFLWTLNLHYFNFLHLLEKIEQKEICLDWINKNPVGKTEGWHPFPVSLRIINWIKADLQIDEINKSIYTQAAYLYRNLQYYHPNHEYLQNAQALIFAGKYFNGEGESSKWLNKGIKTFEKHLPEMISEEGGFFEPSVSYNAIVLYALLDIINIIDEEHEDFFTVYVEKLFTFIGSLTQPDGDIALFHDCSIQYAPKTNDLIFYADDLNIPAYVDKPGSDKMTITNLTGSGYAVIRSEKLYFAMDYGGIRPAHISAHCHPGAFSYELSVEGMRFVVDSGTGSYENDDIRNFVRKSLAHNTVTIDNLEQAETLGAFRYGRIFNPFDVNIIEQGNEILISGKFDGYNKFIGDDLLFSRIVRINKNTVEITDEVTGTGEHQIKSIVHFHPDVVISKDGNSYLLNTGSSRTMLSIIEGKPELHDSHYYPDFGTNFKNKVMVISQSKIPGKIIYRFDY